LPPFRYVQRVRFADVDHAGIVYYPRFFHYFHVAFEELFGQDGAYMKILDQRKVAFPAVHVECDFVRPLRYGDDMTVEVSLDRIGAKSVTLAYLVTPVGADAPCARAKVTCATIDMTTFRAIPVPDDLRALFRSLA